MGRLVSRTAQLCKKCDWDAGKAVAQGLLQWLILLLSLGLLPFSDSDSFFFQVWS